MVHAIFSGSFERNVITRANKFLIRNYITWKYTLSEILQEQTIEMKNDSRMKIDLFAAESLRIKYLSIYPEITNEVLKSFYTIISIDSFIM